MQVIPPKTTTTQIYRGYRPQTAIYNTPLTQQIQPNKTNITKNISPQYYNNINYNHIISISEQFITVSDYIKDAITSFLKIEF